MYNILSVQTGTFKSIFIYLCTIFSVFRQALLLCQFSFTCVQYFKCSDTFIFFRLENNYNSCQENNTNKLVFSIIKAL